MDEEMQWGQQCCSIGIQLVTAMAAGGEAEPAPWGIPHHSSAAPLPASLPGKENHTGIFTIS